MRGHIRPFAGVRQSLRLYFGKLCGLCQRCHIARYGGDNVEAWNLSAAGPLRQVRSVHAAYKSPAGVD